MTDGSTLNYKILPGTPYSEYALPVDYMPSRDYRPRWGATRPPIPQLANWFEAHSAEFREFMELMRTSRDAMADIPLDFSEENLPMPAWFGVPFSPFDAVVLHTMITKYKPKTYLEIGSGITTCFTRKAVTGAGLDTKVISIDPQPRAQVDAICDEVLRDGLETYDLSVFATLEAGDILFFDGSHRSFMNSDVTVFMIDVLPMIKPGVIVHVHDITLPWDYPDMFAPWYWNEQYLLAVYLMQGRHRIKPLAPTSYLCRAPQFADWFKTPIFDFGERNESWTGGGSMWFTHTA